MNECATDACPAVSHNGEHFKVKLNGRKCSFLRKMYTIEQCTRRDIAPPEVESERETC
jgi:hypothetical protein